MANVNTTIIQCDQVTKVYKKIWSKRQTVHALNNISLSIHAGQIMGLVGPNGAGKTTLINLIAGLIPLTRGHITLCGHDVKSKEAHANIGYMPEFPAFLGRYSAREVLIYHCGLLELNRQKTRVEADRVLELLDLSSDADRRCGEFSQGMKRRLSLAVALLKSPNLLLLDEPTNGLDPVNIIKARKLLKQLSDSGTTILISSHRLDELEKITDDFIFLYRGQTVEANSQLYSNRKGELSIHVISNGETISKAIASDYEITHATNTEIILHVNHVNEIPDVVYKLVQEGALITGVHMREENIEDTFMHLYGTYHEDKNAPENSNVE